MHEETIMCCSIYASLKIISHTCDCVHRYVSGLVAWFYILILPFVACIPALDPLAQILLKVVQFPLVAGRNIRDGKLGVDTDSK